MGELMFLMIFMFVIPAILVMYLLEMRNIDRLHAIRMELNERRLRKTISTPKTASKKVEKLLPRRY